MDYYGIGYSNIRVPNETNSYVYRYDTRVNTFPEEVLIHEFLHSLERTAKEYNYDIPALHDNQKYGYTEQKLTGLKDWYEVYMNKGLPEKVYELKPAKASNFKYSYELDKFHEPTNIIEYIKQIFTNVVHNIQYIGQNHTRTERNVIVESVN